MPRKFWNPVQKRGSALSNFSFIFSKTYSTPRLVTVRRESVLMLCSLLTQHRASLSSGVRRGKDEIKASFFFCIPFLFNPTDFPKGLPDQSWLRGHWLGSRSDRETRRDPERRIWSSSGVGREEMQFALESGGKSCAYLVLVLVSRQCLRLTRGCEPRCVFGARFRAGANSRMSRLNPNLRQLFFFFFFCLIMAGFVFFTGHKLV